jgi:hypothetical protein
MRIHSFAALAGLVLSLLGLPGIAHAQNVGIGTSNPLDRLHVTNFIRTDALASTDTNVVLSDVNGRLINLAPGSSGQVLSSRGSGRTPVWSNPAGGSSGRIYFEQLQATITNTTTTASAVTTTLVSRTFTPQNDTVLVTVSVAGRVSATSGMAVTPLQKWAFRILVNGALTKLMYPHLNTNALSGGVATGDLTGSMTIPVAVTPGVPNLILLDVGGLFTTAGSITLRIDPSSTAQHATLTIHDLPTN